MVSLNLVTRRTAAEKMKRIKKRKQRRRSNKKGNRKKRNEKKNNRRKRKQQKKKRKKKKDQKLSSLSRQAWDNDGTESPTKTNKNAKTQQDMPLHHFSKPNVGEFKVVFRSCSCNSSNIDCSEAIESAGLCLVLFFPPAAAAALFEMI